MLRPMGRLRIVGAVVGVLLGAIYILNPTAGVFELLPDNLPFIGNLDEAAATALVIACVRYLMSMRRASKSDETTVDGGRLDAPKSETQPK